MGDLVGVEGKVEVIPIEVPVPGSEGLPGDLRVVGMADLGDASGQPGKALDLEDQGVLQDSGVEVGGDLGRGRR